METPLDFVKSEHKLLWNNGSVIAVLGEEKGVFVSGEGIVKPAGIQSLQLGFDRQPTRHATPRHTTPHHTTPRRTAPHRTTRYITVPHGVSPH